jgi:hypothetical protein
MYENLTEYQKINHFINSAELTRKDRFNYNVGKLQQKFGKNHFDFLPETYSLPEEYADFLKAFNQRKNDDDKNMWIVKPTASS